MDYQEAFNLLINQYGYEVLDNSFFVRSFLLDYLGNKMDSISLVDAYYTLNKDSCVYQSIKELTLVDAKTHIKGVIKASTTDIALITYIRSVEPLLLLIYGDEYKKVGEVKQVNKVNIVRIKKKTKHISPVLVNNPPQQVVNKPTPNVANPKRKKRKIDRKIHINFVCHRLRVNFINGKKIELLDDRGNLINQNMRVTTNQDGYSFFYYSVYDTFTFNIPRDIFSRLYISFSGSYLEFEDTEDRTKFKSIDMDAYCSYLHIERMKAKRIKIKGSGTNISMGGEYEKIRISGNTTVNCHIKNVAKEVKIKTYIGNINLNIGYENVYPKINHFLQKVQRVDKIYWFGRNEVKLNLSTNIGKIKVF